MISWVAYLLVVSALLSVAAWLTEKWMVPRHHRTRWIWVAALSASLLIPGTAPYMTTLRPDRTARASARIVSSAITGVSSRSWITLSDAGSRGWAQLQSRRADRWIRIGWGIASVLMLGWIASALSVLRYRRKQWRPQIALGTKIMVSGDFGPAVVGILRPRIVLPEWALRMPPASQHLVLAHEHSHIESQDPRWLALALGLLALTPWNPLLWWQFGRLRHAMEVDCDRRVLQRGVDHTAYASTLLECAVQRRRLLVTSAAMAESASSLKRRIRLMMTNRVSGWSVSAALAMLCAGTAAIAATQVQTPRAVRENGAELQEYVGDYEFSPVTLLRITRNGQELTARFGNSTPDELISQGRDGFRIKGVDALVSFSRDSASRVSGLTLHQNGADTPAPRISAARVAEIRNTIEAHVHARQPAPGSETALRHLIEGILSGAPDYASLSEQLAGGTRAMLPDLHKQLSELGSVRSISFKGVNQDGWDQYLVQHDRATSSWEIALDGRGTVVGVLWHSGS